MQIILQLLHHCFAYNPEQPTDHFPRGEWHFIYPSLHATVRWGTPGSSANE